MCKDVHYQNLILKTCLEYMSMDRWPTVCFIHFSIWMLPSKEHNCVDLINNNLCIFLWYKALFRNFWLVTKIKKIWCLHLKILIITCFLVILAQEKAIWYFLWRLWIESSILFMLDVKVQQTFLPWFYFSVSQSQIAM